MSSGEMIEGGNFKCLTHPNVDGSVFETNNRKEWDEHCIKSGHTVSGHAPCLYCKTSTVVNEAPYQPIGVPIPAICDKCMEKHVKPQIAKAEATAVSTPAAGGQ